MVPLHSISATRGLSSLVQSFGHAERTGSGFQQYQPANVCHDFLFVLESVLHAYDSILPCFLDIFCIHLGSPDNGYVSLSGNGPGSTATYGCNLGYVRVGTATRTCQDDGEWSGSEPSCRSKQKLVQENNVCLQYSRYMNSLLLHMITSILSCSCALWTSRRSKIWGSDYSEWSFIWSQSPVFL